MQLWEEVIDHNHVYNQTNYILKLYNNTVNMMVNLNSNEGITFILSESDESEEAMMKKGFLLRSQQVAVVVKPRYMMLLTRLII